MHVQCLKWEENPSIYIFIRLCSLFAQPLTHTGGDRLLLCGLYLYIDQYLDMQSWMHLYNSFILFELQIIIEAFPKQKTRITFYFRSVENFQMRKAAVTSA